MTKNKTNKTNKATIITYISDRLEQRKRIELSFTHEDDEYICISLDVFGSGKPEFVVLGNDKYHDAIAVSDDAVTNRQRLSDLFAPFPNELCLTVIPQDLYEDETV